ncbi:hypothetical protein [Polycladomyces subterraneus]|uniref:Uncharacterized protein n=1 Tax=Polycladomyces subterraneus TaxID=1016997 RepID=A0ABT8INI9_9BACL|nr:hypothetical protein [Polycladomyces subterraneus]MDN4594312.1 hypothetical protein [Polycladomyces subterraneus]
MINLTWLPWVLLRIGVENTPFENVNNIVAQLFSGPLTALGGSLFGILIERIQATE